MITTILLVFALVFGALATAKLPEPLHFNFLGAALTFLIAALLFGASLAVH
jgi:uncharacterized membrane protein